MGRTTVYRRIKKLRKPGWKMTKEELMARRNSGKDLGGRRREYDVKKITKELLDWVKSEDSLNFAGFCADRGYLPTLIWRLEKDFPEFAEAYMLAKLRLAERRERFLNAEMLNYGAFQRYQSSYDPFLVKAEDEEKDKEATRRRGVAEAEQTNLFMLAKMASSGKIKQK